MSTNLIRANMELASEAVLSSIMKKDATNVSSNTSKYCKDNALGYYVGVNTWLMIIEQYSAYGWMRVLDEINRHGLFPVIKEADESASELVHGETISSGLFHSIVEDVRNNFSVRNVPVSPGRTINMDFMATALFVLRYLKRFSPLDNDIVQKESIIDFLNVENRSKLLQRRGYSHWYISSIQETIMSLLDWDDLCDKLEAITIDDIEFTSGSGLDSKSTLGSKLVAIANDAPEYFKPIFGTYTTGAYNKRVEMRYGAYGDLVRPVKVQAVPKSYKAARIIAMEETVRQCLARRAFTICDRYTPTCIPIHDQTVNQRLALAASIDGSLATVDLSHASDCITKLFGMSVLPARFVKLITPLLGNFTIINGKYRPMQQLSTAGNSLTFWLESIIFFGIAKTAAKLAMLFNEDLRDLETRIFVYGDDIIINDEFFETLVDLLHIGGFIVNEAKSFHGKAIYYRESCGIEAIDGMDISSLYYPRFPIEGMLRNGARLKANVRRDGFKEILIDSTTSMVDLQHKLYGVCYKASRFVFEILREAHPRMTTSKPFSELADCWEYVDTCVLTDAPMGEVVPVIETGILSGVERVVGWKLIKSYQKGTRTRKYLPRVVYTKSDITDYQRRLYDCYRYHTFLKCGPRYSDDLARLLQVSEKPKPIDEVFGEPTIKWSLLEIDYK